MHIPGAAPWTTTATISTVLLLLLLPLASAFYPYTPSSGSTTASTRRTLISSSASNTNTNVPRRPLTLPLHPRANTYTILSSTDPSQKNSVAVDQDGADLSYMAAVGLGESKEEYYMLLDSAASSTWVMGEGCKSEACGRHGLFGVGDSGSLKTSTTPFTITYGTGTVSGTLASDTLTLGALTPPTPFPFGLATNVSTEFASYPMDGILGLGRGTSPSSSQLIPLLASAGLIDAPLYGLALSRAADGGKDGELNLGAVNSARVDGAMKWMDALDNSDGFWEVSIGDAGVDGRMAGLKGKSGIVDTGTSFVFLPPSDALAVHRLVPGFAQDGETFSVPCSTAQNIMIKFGDATFGILSKDWVGGKTGADGDMCRSNIFGRKTFGDDQWLLGDVFLKNVYAAFDFDKKQVGFGVLKGSSSSSSPSFSTSSPSSSPSSTASGSPLLPGSASATVSSSAASETSPTSSAQDQPGGTSTLSSHPLWGLYTILAMMYLFV